MLSCYYEGRVRKCLTSSQSLLQDSKERRKLRANMKLCIIKSLVTDTVRCLLFFLPHNNNFPGFWLFIFHASQAQIIIPFISFLSLSLSYRALPFGGQ